MTFFGLVFIFHGRTLSHWMLPNQPAVADLCAKCLFLAGFSQPGFAAAMIFSGALRGAGDTFTVMIMNLSSILGFRLIGVLVAVYVLGGGLVAVWVVLCIDLLIRGGLAWARFAAGKWRHVEV